jgi:uncharacterized membrane protein HdeD (DUF308 family)
MTRNPLESAYRHTWWALTLRGLLGVALGAIILWRPIEAVAAFALVIAVWALFGGIVQIVQAFDLRQLWSQWWVMALGGLVSAGFGVAAIRYYPALSLAFAVGWTAWWLLLTGGLAIYLAIQERQLGVPWAWTMVSGIAGIATGILALVSPPATLAAIMGLVAGFAIVSGVALLVGAYRLAAAKREVAGAFESGAAAR